MTIMTKEEIIVRFVIYSQQLTPEIITKKLNLIPSTTWNKGDKRPRTNQKYANNGWILEPTVDRKTPLDTQLTSLLDQLYVSYDAIMELPRDSADLFAVQCINYTTIPRPEYYIATSLLEIMAKLQLDLWIETYPLK